MSPGERVPRLTDISVRIIAQALVPVTVDEHESAESPVLNYLIGLLDSQVFSCVSEEILSHLVKYYPCELTDRCLQALCPSHLREFSVKNCYRLTWPGVQTVLFRLQNLQSLDLSECDQLMSPDLDLLHGLDLCSTLTSVTLEDCLTLTDFTVQSILRQAKSLRNLNISSCDRITDEVFLLNEDIQLTREAQGETFMEYDCHLTSVNISLCANFTSTGVRHLVTLTGPTLQSLNLHCVDVDYVTLLYLCGYGLAAAVSIVLNEYRGCEKSEELVKNLEKLQSLLAKTRTSERQLTKTLAVKTDGKAAEEWLACDKDKILPSVGLANKTDIVSKSTGASMLNLAGASQGSCSGDTKVTSGDFRDLREGGTQTQVGPCQDCCSKDAHIVLDDFSEIQSVLKTYVSDSFSIEELHTPECSYAESSSESGKRFMKPQAVGVENEGASADNKLCRKEAHENLDVFANLKKEKLFWDTDFKKSKEGTSKSSAFQDSKVKPNCSQRICSSSSLNSGPGSLNTEGNKDDDLPRREAFVIKNADCAHSDLCPGSQSEKIKSDALSVERETVSNNEFPTIVTCDRVKVSSKELSTELVGSGASHKNTASAADMTTSQPFQMYAPGLVSVDIFIAEPKGKNETLTQRCLELFLEHNKNISKLSISWKGLTNEMMARIAAGMKLVEELSLEDCDHLTCPGIQEVGNQCPNLTALNLKGVWFIKDEAVRPCLRRGSLRHLSLAESGIGDVTLQQISQTLAGSIESLELGWCEEITESGVCSLFSCDYPHLVEFSFQQGPVSNTGLTLIADHCRGLTSLVLSSLRCEIEDDAVVSLALSLPLLRKIVISWNSGLTDRSADAFLTYCPNLEVAVFTGIKRITSETFMKLIADDGEWLKFQTLLHKVQKCKLHKSRLKEWTGKKEAGIAFGYPYSRSISHVETPNLEVAVFTGIKRITSETFVKLIADDGEWLKFQTLLHKVQKCKLHKSRLKEWTGKKMKNLTLPYRSTVFAPVLCELDLEYCDLVEDFHLGAIAAVCRGSLKIWDYHAKHASPVWFSQCPVDMNSLEPFD